MNLDNSLKHIDVYITEICNLNCKFCGNFTPLVKEDNSDSVENIVQSLIKLRDITKNTIYHFTDDIGLIGGEPLLNKPKLFSVIKLLRKESFNKCIYIGSNGLLLYKLTDNDRSFLLDYSVKFRISDYGLGLNFDKYRDLIDDILDQSSMFEVKMSDKRYNRLNIRNIWDCRITECFTLRKGNLYRCCISGGVHNLDDSLGTNYKNIRDKDRGKIWINLESDDFISFMRNTLCGELCHYCYIGKYFKSSRHKNNRDYIHHKISGFIPCDLR